MRWRSCANFVHNWMIAAWMFGCFSHCLFCWSVFCYSGQFLFLGKTRASMFAYSQLVVLCRLAKAALSEVHYWHQRWLFWSQSREAVSLVICRWFEAVPFCGLNSSLPQPTVVRVSCLRTSCSKASLYFHSEVALKPLSMLDKNLFGFAKNGVKTSKVVRIRKFRQSSFVFLCLFCSLWNCDQCCICAFEPSCQCCNCYHFSRIFFHKHTILLCTWSFSIAATISCLFWCNCL